MTSESVATNEPQCEIEAETRHSRQPKTVALKGRPRSVPGEEAYLRSELERAAIDIAAGL